MRSLACTTAVLLLLLPQPRGTESASTTQLHASPGATSRGPVLPSDPLLSWYPKRLPLLPVPRGHVVRVRTSAELAAAADALRSGTTILMAPGRYRLTRTLALANARDVALRGASGHPDHVVLEGPGLRNAPAGSLQDGIWTSNVQDLLLAGFTIRDLPRHCIIFNAGTERPVIRAVRFVDCGEQAVKANPDASGRGVPGGVVEHSRFEYLTTSRGAYTNAISAIGARGWAVRHSVFRNIRAPQGEMAGPALLFRGGAGGTIVEANTFVDCQRGVSFGMVDGVPPDHLRGVVRNNFFVRAARQPGDSAVSLWNAPAATVAHNTILLNGTFHAAIDYRFAEGSELVIVNNLLDAAVWQRRDTPAVMAGNLTGTRSGWFRDAAAGDLRLTAAADAPVGRATVMPGARVETDWEGDPRPATGADIGADQR